MDKGFYQQLCSEEKTLQSQIAHLNETLDAVRVLKKRYSENTPAVINRTETVQINSASKSNLLKMKFPLHYEERLNQFQKTYIAVRQLGSAFSSEIAEKLHQLDPNEFNEEKALKVAREKASDLAIAGVFGAEKFGVKNKYFIKEKP